MLCTCTYLRLKHPQMAMLGRGCCAWANCLLLRACRPNSSVIFQTLRNAQTKSRASSNKMQTAKLKSRGNRTVMSTIKQKKLSDLVKPLKKNLEVEDEEDDMIGEELVGKLAKAQIMKVLAAFAKDESLWKLGGEQGLDRALYTQSLKSFKTYLLEASQLPTSLHILLHDLCLQNGHVADLFPYFLEHSKEIFPHLECLDELSNISDLRKPALWYPEARERKRKFIFHAGPTNSGKTYKALQRFTTSSSGVYCGPLKLLANEVCTKTNAMGTPCDMVTGEERRFANEDLIPSDHLACTVEMVNTTNHYEVAVIDEIQMIRDYSRGWAWTRAILGVNADEVHLCGENSAIFLVKEILAEVGEEVEVNTYDRLTSLTVETSALESLENVQPGDCIVCFSKKAIYDITQALEKLGHEVAVVYGSLPPGTKISQAKRFNDPKDPCKLMVATDAIGMGLNLSIRRIIFHSLYKFNKDDCGQRTKGLLQPSQALQIAGRAGRYGTDFESGYVTTLHKRDLPKLTKLLRSKVPDIEKAGLHPTADQIEMFSFYLPKLKLSNLVDVFVHQCSLDGDRFFLSDMEIFKELADLTAHIPLDLRVKYTFCVAPIKIEDKIIVSFFLRYARQTSHGQPVTAKFLKRTLNWPLNPPRTTAMMNNLESVYQGLDLYRWFGIRFPDMFPDIDQVRKMQDEIDQMIFDGVTKFSHLSSATDIEEP